MKPVTCLNVKTGVFPGSNVIHGKSDKSKTIIDVNLCCKKETLFNHMYVNAALVSSRSVVLFPY